MRPLSATFGHSITRLSAALRDIVGDDPEPEVQANLVAELYCQMGHRELAAKSPLRGVRSHQKSSSTLCAKMRYVSWPITITQRSGILVLSSRITSTLCETALSNPSEEDMFVGNFLSHPRSCAITMSSASSSLSAMHIAEKASSARRATWRRGFIDARIGAVGCRI